MSVRCWAAAVIVAFLWSGSLSAEVIFDADATINYPIDDDVLIQGAVFGPDFDPPVINVLDSADISGTVRMLDTVFANFSGGTIRDQLFAYGGTVPSVLNFSGTRFERKVNVVSDAIANVSGGEFYEGFHGLHAIVNVSGGVFYNNWIGQGGLRSLVGGAFSISGGVVFGETYLANGSAATISGGHLVGGLRVSYSTAEVFAGRIDDRLGASYGEIHLYGGQIKGDLHAMYSGTIHVYGFDLLHTESLLTGTLADGSPISVSTMIWDDGQWPDGQIVLHQIPEPAVGVLAIWAVLALVVPYRTGLTLSDNRTFAQRS